MAIDPSIPFRAATAAHVNLADIYAQADEQKYRQQQMQMRQQEMDARASDAARKQQAATSLSQLVQQRAAGGKWDTTSPEFQSYAQNDPDGALEILKGMDEQQRKQVEEGVKDLSAAVQWADSPEKWAVVQRHYGAIDPQLAAVPFERRQESLISLGQMGEYLKATAPELKTVEPGGGLYSVNKDGSGFKVVVAPNDGSGTLGAPVGGGPRPGQVEDGYRFKGGNPADPNNWIKVGGAGGNASGGFRPVGIAGERVTSTRRSPERNKRVGGVANSYHLSGLARDSVPPPGMSMGEYHRRLKALNPHLDVINEGDHIHMEPKG